MKKLITGIILAVVFGASVYGAAYRTKALYDKESGNSNQSTLIANSAGIENEEKDTVTLLAVAESVNNDKWVLVLENLTTIEIEGRTLNYLISKNFTASPGEKFSLIGFYETPDSFEISEITNLASGLIVIVRDINGRPAWGQGGGSH